jgi:hypothetical protein
MGLFLALMTLTLVGGMAYVLPVVRSISLEERLRRLLTVMVSGLVGYVLFGMGLIPLEQVQPIARVVESWLPYEALPVAVCLLFAGAGLLFVGLGKRVGSKE